MARPVVFTRLADGTLLRRRTDGSFAPMRSKTDRGKVRNWTDAEIEKMTGADTDHSPLDADFWKAINHMPRKEAISIKLDDDVLTFFRK